MLRARLQNALQGPMTPLRLALYLSAGLLAFWVGLRAIAGLFPGGPVQVYQAHHRVPVPVEVPVVKQVTRWKTQTVEVPVQVFVPTEKEAAKIEKETGLVIPKDEKTLGVYPIPKAPWGGNLYLGLRGDGTTHATFAESKRPKIILGGAWRFGAGFLTDDELQQGFRVLAGKDILSVRDITLVGEVSLDRLGGESNPRAFVGFEWRK